MIFDIHILYYNTANIDIEQKVFNMFHTVCVIQNIIA